MSIAQNPVYIDFTIQRSSIDRLRDFVDSVDDMIQRGFKIEHVTFEFGRHGDGDAGRVYFFDDSNEASDDEN